VTHVHAAFISGSAQYLPVLLRACALGSAGARARGVRVHLFSAALPQALAMRRRVCLCVYVGESECERVSV
jgi:hypothetical protein